MDFHFYAPTRLVVGLEKRFTVKDWIQGLGKRIFFVVGESQHKSDSFQSVYHSLHSQGYEVNEYVKPTGEPTVSMVNQATKAALEWKSEIVLSLGGGSVIDLGKAVAGLVTNGGEILDYLEGVGAGKPVTKAGLHHVAIPTTAGTGAEVTRNAVITSPQEKFKKSFRSPYLYPNTAILDGELIAQVPPQQAAYSGMDAITQLMESYISHKATPYTDRLAIWGLEMALRSIRPVVNQEANAEVRQQMLLASTLSGLCLANAGLGLAHGFASGLGAMYEIPHGKACAILLPYALSFNRDAVADKLIYLGKLLNPDVSMSKQGYADWVVNEIIMLNKELSIPSNFKEYSIPESDHEQLVEKSMGNSMWGNPIEITPEIGLNLVRTFA